MSTQPSLRDLYADPSTTWAFKLPTVRAPQNVSTTVARTPPSSSYQWTSRSPHDSILNLSPSLDLSEPTVTHAGQFLKTLVASTLLQYTTTAAAMPWEVGKVLLQVQWVPRDAGEPEPTEYVEEVENEDAFSDASNDDAYFADPSATPTAKYPAPKPTDEQGYVIRRSVMEEGTRPEYIIPVGSADGVWGMIKRVGRFRGEGWLALWKGLLTSCAIDFLSETIRPILRNFLKSILYPSLSPFHRPPILLPVASHLLTGFLLSPLDLVRTRLIVQSFTPRYRTYTGPLDALTKILRHEGGLKGVYLHPHLLLPTLIDNTLRPLVSLYLPGILASYFGRNITEESNPIVWAFAELCGSCLSLLVTSPFQTVRRRLQVQVRGTAKPIKSCVELRPTPYNGIVDTFWHIITEERSDLPITPKRQRHKEARDGKSQDTAENNSPEDDYESWTKHTGIGQLYRGLGMRFGAVIVVFVLAALSGGQETDSGWAEI
ncbi:hypothetical protein AMATHDRAFT_60382, partial [Amanita thiersii Skay4041]